jgi:hypothetical protein
MISAAGARGIRVYGVFDHSWHSANQYALHQRFLDAATTIPSIFPRYDGNENFLIGNSLHGSKCHNKLMVVDGGTPDGFVVTGSFNFSKAASYKGNDENFLIIYDPVLATSYSNYVAHLYAQGYHPTRDLGGDAAAWQEVWISEINWAGSMSDGGLADPADKFIELHNRSTRPIDISGWQVTGTAASALSWRILMHIVPRGALLAPGGRFVIALSTNRAFAPPAVSTDPFLYLHHPQDQNFVFLTLKDRDGRIIDEAGSGIQAPFAGSQNSGGYASMERIGTNGRSAASWQNTVTVSTQSVRAGYRMLTRATPGH